MGLSAAESRYCTDIILKLLLEIFCCRSSVCCGLLWQNKINPPSASDHTTTKTPPLHLWFEWAQTKSPGFMAGNSRHGFVSEQ